MQTALALIRRRVLWRLNCVYTVCQCPFVWEARLIWVNCCLLFCFRLCCCNVLGYIRTQDKIFRHKRLSTGANFVHVHTDMGQGYTEVK